MILSPVQNHPVRYSRHFDGQGGNNCLFEWSRCVLIIFRREGKIISKIERNNLQASIFKNAKSLKFVLYLRCWFQPLILARVNLCEVCYLVNYNLKQDASHMQMQLCHATCFSWRHARDSVQWFSELILILTQVNASNKLCIPPFSLTLFEVHNQL